MYAIPVEISWNSPGVSCVLAGPALAGFPDANATTATARDAARVSRLVIRLSTAFAPSVFGGLLSSSFGRLTERRRASTALGRETTPVGARQRADRRSTRSSPIRR